MELRDIYEKMGLFYLGKERDLQKGEFTDELFLLKSNDLTTHAAIIGMTGSGKTGLGISLIEEAVLDGIPSLIIDPKGDMSNLLLAFPEFRPEDFLPWIDASVARRKGLEPYQFAEKTAKVWKEGIESYGQNSDRVRRFKNSADFAVYTPGSSAGLPLNILASFDAPSSEVMEDGDTLAELLNSTVSSVLSLIDEDSDPLTSKPYILLSAIFKHFWLKGVSLSLEDLVGYVVNPPFDRVGVLPLKSFYPQTERLKLAMLLNGVLANPSFANWIKGENLDIGKLLYTADGKPRVSILSIAHLNDNERMFFVTLLLNRVISWMRGLNGTGSLRALLYMDEIFGFFPSTSNPPSKKPMLLLLKQARAYGLGIVLSTQNPVDLDYKGLSNIGSWFLGRLQTKQDIERVADGLVKAGDKSLNEKDVKSILAGMPKRTFLLKSAHLDNLLMFGTRWVMSYLAGPLSKNQIEKLMADRKKSLKQEKVENKTPSYSHSKSNSKPMVPSGLKEYFDISPVEECAYLPVLYARAQVRFYNATRGIDKREEYSFCYFLDSKSEKIEWDKGEKTDFDAGRFSKQPVSSCEYTSLPSFFSSLKSVKVLEKEFADYLYGNCKLTLYRVKKLKMESKPEEKSEDFVSRVKSVLREKREAEVEKAMARFEKKKKRLEERLEKAYAKLEKEKSDVSAKTTDTVLSFGMTILDTFFGRKRVKKSTVSSAGRAFKSAGRVYKEKKDVEIAQDKVADLEKELELLDKEAEETIGKIAEKYEIENFPIEEFFITPRKSDILNEEVFLVWSANFKN